MIDTEKLDNKDQVPIILSLFNHVNSEITRYRDLEWRVTAWVVAIIAGVTASPHLASLTKLSYYCGMKLFATLFVFATAGYGIWHIIYIHKQLTIQRKVRRDIGILLRFYEKGIYSKNFSLPASWDKETTFEEGKEHLISFFVLIIVVSIISLFIIWNIPD
jgi:hypothetical protein